MRLFKGNFNLFGERVCAAEFASPDPFHLLERCHGLATIVERAVAQGVVGDEHPSSEKGLLIVKGNLASTYQMLGRREQALAMYRDVYFGTLKLEGRGHRDTLGDAFNYAYSLVSLDRFQEARPLMRKTLPVARRVLGENRETTIKMRALYAQSLYEDPAATLDDLREAVTTLEDVERTARRVLGGAHPLVDAMEGALQDARAALRAREETQSGGA